MPKQPDFLERLSKDDPNYEVAKRFYLEAWADSHGSVADAHAGRASLSDYVEACVKTFAQGADIHIALKDSTSPAEKCQELDSLAKKFISKFRRSLAPHSERLGEGDVKAAVDELSRRVNEITARSKQRFFEQPLTPKVLAAPPTEPTRRSSRAILLHRLVPDSVAHVKVLKITYEFPAVFSEIAKRRFQAKKLRAERVLEEKKGSARKFADAEALLLEFILDVLFALVLVEELYLLGMQHHLTVEDFETECLKLLQTSALQAGFMDNLTMVSAPTPDNAAISADVWAKIESSAEWKSYRRLLQKVADAQAGEESSHLEDALFTTLPELEDGNNIEEEGYALIPRADWRKDAARARKPPAFLRPVRAARLTAMATLHKEAAATAQSVWPTNKQQVEQYLWPVFSKYAEDVFDKAAEAKLRAKRPGGRLGAYSRWLRSKCLSAVVDDVCRPVLGQFLITVRHAVETIGERQSPEIQSTRRALWGMLTEVLGGPFTGNLRNSLSVGLEARSTYWEARFEGASVSGTADVAHCGSGTKTIRQLDAYRNQLLTEAQTRWRPTAGRKIPFAWAHKAAGVDHKDAYSWKSGKLSAKSQMAISIERVLQSPEPPKKPNPSRD